jgi:hypothetical protein
MTDYVYCFLPLGQEHVLCGMRNGHLSCLNMAQREAVSEFKLSESIETMVMGEEEGPVY